MKKLITVISALLLSLSIYAQSPEKFSYQAVVRDSNDDLVVSSTTPIKVSILKSTITGTVVYTETQTPTTNVNGLLSIEIGAGTVVSGSMSTVDWGGDAHFIKTEVDVDNDGNYDITGTSQLLSVPYALNANTLTGGIDAAFINDLVTRIEALEPQPVQVGDYKDGGVVFWVDPTDNTHGLICAAEDQSTGAIWGCQGTLLSGANGSAIGTGAANTSDILSGCTVSNTAAEIANNLSLNGYDDWFLPSKSELYEMYLNKSVIDATAIANGGTAFADYYYNTSTQSNNNTAFCIWFPNGNQIGNNKDSSALQYVRAIRAF